MDACVAVEFRVERECDLIPVFHGDNLLGVCAIGISVCTCRPRKNLHIVADGFEEWGTDKCLRDLPDMRDLIFGEKTAELSAVSVATDNGGERREMGVSFACDFFGKQDGACTCRKYGQSSLNFSPERFKKPEVAQEFPLYGTFASGENESVDSAVQVSQLADFKDIGAERLQDAFMFDECPLYR